MNKLDEIIQKQNLQNGFVTYPFTGREILSVKECKQIAIEFAKHILEEAADNANLIGKPYHNQSRPIEYSDGVYECRSNDSDYQWRVNRESITEILNKYL